MIRRDDIHRGLYAALAVWCLARLLGVETPAANTLAALVAVLVALASSAGRRSEMR
jgi:hypothetical protein